jgi:hypothetical protein
LKSLGIDYHTGTLKEAYQCLDNHLQQYCKFRGDVSNDDSWVRHEIERLRKTGNEETELENSMPSDDLTYSSDLLREVLGWTTVPQSSYSEYERSGLANCSGNNMPRYIGPPQNGYDTDCRDPNASSPDVLGPYDGLASPTRLNHCIYWQEEEANGFLL